MVSKAAANPEIATCKSIQKHKGRYWVGVEISQTMNELWVNAVGEPPEDRRREAATEAAGVGSDSTRGVCPKYTSFQPKIYFRPSVCPSF
jgi:hypothetical protein